MRYRIAVTFETPTSAAPATVRVEIEASAASTAARKAIVAAQQLVRIAGLASIRGRAVRVGIGTTRR
jgi:hypothetical protein